MTVVIGSQSNVPDVGDPITSPWHQDTATKIVHRFASLAAANAWTTAPDGAVCITTDTATSWKRIGGVWRSSTWVRAWRAAALTVPAAAYTPIVFDTKAGDADGAYNVATGEYTAAVSGVYHYESVVTCLLNNNPQPLLLAVFVNGVAETRGTFVTVRGGVTGDLWGLVVAGSSNLTAGAKITFRVYNGGANAVQLDSGPAANNMSVYRVNP